MAYIGLIADDLLARAQSGRPSEELRNQLAQRIVDVYTRMGPVIVDVDLLLEEARAYRLRGDELRKTLPIGRAPPQPELTVQVLGGEPNREQRQLAFDSAKAMFNYTTGVVAAMRRRAGITFPRGWTAEEAAKAVVHEFRRVQPDVVADLGALLSSVVAKRMGAYVRADGAELLQSAHTITKLPENATAFHKTTRVITVYDPAGTPMAVAEFRALDHGAVAPYTGASDVAVGAPVNLTVKRDEQHNVLVLASFYARPGAGADALRYLLDLIYGRHKAFNILGRDTGPSIVLLDVLDAIQLLPAAIGASDALAKRAQVAQVAAKELGVSLPPDDGVGIAEFSRDALEKFYRGVGFTPVMVRTTTGRPVSKYPTTAIRPYNVEGEPRCMDAATLFMAIQLGAGN